MLVYLWPIVTPAAVLVRTANSSTQPWHSQLACPPCPLSLCVHLQAKRGHSAKPRSNSLKPTHARLVMQLMVQLPHRQHKMHTWSQPLSQRQLHCGAAAAAAHRCKAGHMLLHSPRQPCTCRAASQPHSPTAPQPRADWCHRMHTQATAGTTAPAPHSPPAQHAQLCDTWEYNTSVVPSSQYLTHL